MVASTAARVAERTEEAIAMTIKNRFKGFAVGRGDATSHAAPPGRGAASARLPLRAQRQAWTPRPSPGAYALLVGADRTR